MLELQEDCATQEIQRRIQHLAWLLLGAFLAAALAGLLPFRHEVIRAALVYAGLLVLIRIAGRRALANLSSFDLVLLLIISEAVDPALQGESLRDVGRSFVIVGSLVGIDVALSFAKLRWPRRDAWLDGLPLALMKDGQVLDARLEASRVNREDLLAAARAHGLPSLDRVEHAVLETTGQITVISTDAGAAPGRKSDPVF